MFPIWNHYRKSAGTSPRFTRRPDRANRLVRMEHGKIPSYYGDAVHFRARFTRHSTSHPNIRDSWCQVMKGTLTVIPIPGLHHQIIQEPYAGLLARELAKKIAERQPVKASEPVA